MPKRLVDGDRIWTSDKIGEIEPESFRPEYANLIPLGLANGSFECEARRVWRDVYSYNRPSISTDHVEDMLDEFERVRLLFRWHDEQGKVWGFWVGITSEGLLPAKSQQKDYKKGKEPPADLLDKFVRGEINTGLTKGKAYSSFGPQGDPKGTPKEYEDGLGFGLPLVRLGSDSGENENPSILNNSEDKDTDKMNPVREIPKITQRVLGIEGRVWPSEAARLKELSAIHGGTCITNLYEQWLEDNGGETRRPVQDFLGDAPRMLSGTYSPAASKATVDLSRKLTFLSKGTVAFDDRQKTLLGKVLKDYPEDAISAAFKEFLDNLKTDQDLAFAAKNFSEKVDALTFSVVENRRLRAIEEAASGRAKEILSAQGESDREARRLAREAEEALVEDTLE